MPISAACSRIIGVRLSRTRAGVQQHHCTSSAFQSGTDEADETTREGFHFTVGKLGKDQESEVHARLTLAGIHYEFDNLEMILEGFDNPFKDNLDLDDNMLHFLQEHNNRMLSRVPDNWDQYDFTDQFNNVSKKTWVTKSPKSYHRNYGFYGQQSLGWEEDDMYPVKKTDVNINPDDLVDELIEHLTTGWSGEESIMSYYTHYESKDYYKLSDLTLGNTTNEEYERVISAMCTNESFLASTEGKEFQKSVEEFLDEYKSMGYSYSFNDIQQEFEFNRDENRSTVQHMATKGLS